jgi:hypothetical protein
MERLSYSGYLIFTPVRISPDSRLPEQSKSNLRNHLANELQQYSKGHPENPSQGFEFIPLGEHRDRRLEPWIYQELENLVYFRYISESFSEIEAFVDGDYKDAYERTVDEVDIFWFHPDILLFRGKEYDVNQAQTSLQKTLFDDFFLESTEIRPHILLKNGVEKNQDDHLIIKNLKQVTIEDVDAHTDSVTLSGNDLISRPELNSGVPKKITAEFDIYGQSLLATISPEQIHVRAANDIGELSDADRLILSAVFCNEILKKAGAVVGR